jgi:hypothetical protein
VNTWTHLASTYDGATLRLYLNGSQVASTATTGNIEVSGGVLRIGGNAIWGEYFSGLIDEVRIYNRALTPAQIQTDMNTPIGNPELMLGEPMPATDTASLSQQQVRPLFNEAVQRWSAALPDSAHTLRSADVVILDLPGRTLGLASGRVIYLDRDAAGYGWFIDPTPRDDAEFAAGLVDSAAAGRVDLLTVLTHEMGHVLGLDDDHAADPVTGNVMADVLPVGVRRIDVNGLLPATPLSSSVHGSVSLGLSWENVSALSNPAVGRVSATGDEPSPAATPVSLTPMDVPVGYLAMFESRPRLVDRTPPDLITVDGPRFMPEDPLAQE